MLFLHLALLALAAVPTIRGPQEADLLRGGPVHYDAPATAGLVERVARRLETGDLALAFDEDAGYLPALLEALGIPVSSQGLVFSKTSFQDERITPATPRAVYFGDEAYVGTIPGAPIVEITSMDGERGLVFYTLEQDAGREPRIVRRHDECLQCHVTTGGRGWPVNLVRSVHPDREGHPYLRSGTERVTHATPIERRWGGWYVTGTHGEARHLGNAIADEESETIDPGAGANVEDLGSLVDTRPYLSPHSDIVALMVLEHQAEMHSRIARAGYEVRLALHRQEEANELFGDPQGTLRSTTKRVLRTQAEELLEYLLFEDEVRLPAEIRGTSGFAQEFQASGRKDEQGRSLRELDLERYLFRYPCSYLIHSPAFDALPAELLHVVYRELWNVLTGERESLRLDEADRRAVLELLLATKDGLPAYWRG